MEGTACPVNLRPRGRRQRALVAAAMLLALAAGIGTTAWTDPPRGMRLLLALPVFVGALAWFQARAGT